MRTRARALGGERSRAARCASLALAIALVLLPAALHAQELPSPPASPPSAVDAAAARRNFESGLKLFGEQAYAEAAVAFEASYRLGGRPSALKNLAQAQRSARRFVLAYEAYEQLLALHEAALSPADRAAVLQAKEELAILTVSLTITVNEPGAAIELDGRPLGTSPLPKGKRVTVADHKIRCTKAGFEPFERSLETRSGKDEVVVATLVAEVKVGRVAVREPGGRDVRVFVDGQDRGPAPWEGELPPGEHAIELRSARFASEKRTVAVVAKERLDVALDAAPLTGHLRVTTLPASATIAVDGKTVGSGVWDADVAPGSHHVEVSLAGGAPAVRELFVQRGETVVQEIPLLSSVGPAAPLDYRGVYVRLNALLALPLSSAPDNVAAPATSDGGAHVGIGGALRVGYALDPLAIELVGAVMLEHRDQSVAYPDPVQTYSRHVDFESNSPAAFVGAGPRVTSRGETTRFTFGLAPGFSLRQFRVTGRFSGQSPSCAPGQQSCTSSDESFPAAGYTAFGFMADGGVLLGSTPGTKFFLGVHAWLDFPPRDVVVGPVDLVPAGVLKSPGAGYVVVDSVQFFIGPVLGVQFGH